MLLTTMTPTADIITTPTEINLLGDDDSQLLYGEKFFVEESHGAHVLGYRVSDHHKGYVERDQLMSDQPSANASVIVPSTHLYPDPDFHTRPEYPLYFLSALTLTDKEENGFIQTHSGEWIFKSHTSLVSDFMPKEISQIAALYLHCPYMAGGRTVNGIGAYGLFQNALHAIEKYCPAKNSDKTVDDFEQAIALSEQTSNDIVFFKNHVGIMMDEDYVISANPLHMLVTIEPLQELIAVFGDIKKIVRL